MTLRPFLLLAICLLGACGKKDAAPGSHSPDIATTKSTRNEGERESRSAHGDRAAKTDAIQAIDRLIREMEQAIRTRDREGEDAILTLQDAKAAIRSADPAEFDVIWRRLDAVTDPEFRDALQLLAIYHVSAQEDLIAAGLTMRELLHPGPVRLGELLSISDPTPAQLIGYLRQNESSTHRDMVAQFIPHNRFDREGLTALAALTPPLTNEESRIIVGTMAGGLLIDQGDVLNHDDGTEASRRLEMIGQLEEQGVFQKGARESYLRDLGKSHADLFVKVVPADELMARLRMDGYDGVIGTIVFDEMGGDRFDDPGSDIPHTFFTPTGTRNLPLEKTAIALGMWHMCKPTHAEAWFADNAASLPQSQQDQARAGFARNAWNEDPAAARKWVDQISDPELRAKALIQRHGDGN